MGYEVLCKTLLEVQQVLVPLDADDQRQRNPDFPTRKTGSAPKNQTTGTSGRAATAPAHTRAC